MPKIMIFGGVANSILNFRRDLITEWLNRGCLVTAVTGTATKEQEASIKAAGIEFYTIPLEREGLNPARDLRALLSLFRIIKAINPDIMFVYTAKPIVLSGICLLFKRKIKLYVMITGLGYGFAGETFRQRAVKRLLNILYRPALGRSEAVFFQNRDDRALFLEIGLVNKGQNLVLVNGSGVNLDYYYYSEAQCSDEVVFLLIARMIYSKGVRHYAEAAALLREKYDNVRFLLLGPLAQGPDRISKEEIEMLQAKETVEYLGRQQDVRPFIEGCHVYVLPSFYREGVPRSVLEAMSMGRPIITTDAPGCRETVVDGVNGFLVPVKDGNALAEAMERFILEKALVAKMGRESRRIAEDKFDVKIVNEQINNTLGLVNS